MQNISDMFHAQSVAVVGASANPDKMGHTILHNIIAGGYRGMIFPVNPRGGDILGYPSYPSIVDIPHPVDLVVIVVPAPFVPDIIEQAGRINVKGIIIITGGFREIGNDALDAEVMNLARGYGIPVVGPNCQGVNYTPNKLCASWPLITAKGPIAVISQSGTIGAAISMWAEKDEIGISAFVSLGNRSDVSEIDLMYFFAEDEETRCIALNIEGVSDGKRFIDCIRKIADVKPIIVLKPGRSPEGQRAAESHTKAIGGDDAVFDALCRQFNLIRAYDLDEFYDLCKLAAFISSPMGNNLAVITSSGGSGILAVDAAVENGLKIPKLSDESISKLKEILPSQCVISNPLDLTGDALADRYSDALEVLRSDCTFDTFLVIFGDPIPDTAEVFLELMEKSEKKFIVSYLGGGDVEESEKNALHRISIPVFPTPERAVKAISAIQKYYERKDEKKDEV
ncbi:MAG TPA: CoA-binding protein [Clostridiaceae bacterium]|nr:CoA-binding protein [Clostridiaceae bacterium]